MPLSPDITPDPLRAPTMAEIERAREMYAQGFAVARCLAAAPMSLGTLYYWLDGGPFLGPTTDKSAVGLGPTTDTSAGSDEHGGRMLAPVPRRRVIVGKRRKPLNASTASLIARLTRTAERAALDIEQRLARPSPATPERERDVRMLASLVQSLRGLTALAPEMAGAAPAIGGEALTPAVAQMRAERETLWRATEEGVALMRDIVKAFAALRTVEHVHKQKRAADQTKQQELDEFRAVVAQRIRGFAAARAAEEGAEEAERAERAEQPNEPAK
jgi:hypothetical protein